MSSDLKGTPLFSFSRIWIIAANTFTHLLRMKVLSFLGIFVLVWIGVNFLKLPHTAGPESVGGEELRMLKNPLVGTMLLFAIIIAIVATALIIPKDLEDRTLYTILSKPVPRLDYLLGKLIGVLLLIFVGLTLMTAFLDAVVWHRMQGILTEWNQVTDQLVAQQQWTVEDQEEARQELLSQGVTWSLHAAILAIFLQAAIIAALALLISTFSSSTLFTVVISTLCYFIGQMISAGRDHWLQAVGDEGFSALVIKIIVAPFPDFRPFEIVDEAVAGQPFPPDVLGSLALSAFFYVGIYVVLSWFIFSDKEI